MGNGTSGVGSETQKTAALPTAVVEGDIPKTDGKKTEPSPAAAPPPNLESKEKFEEFISKPENLSRFGIDSHGFRTPLNDDDKNKIRGRFQGRFGRLWSQLQKDGQGKLIDNPENLDKIKKFFATQTEFPLLPPDFQTKLLTEAVTVIQPEAVLKYFADWTDPQRVKLATQISGPILARDLMSRGKVEEAAREFDRAVAQNPEDLELRRDAAKAYQAWAEKEKTNDTLIIETLLKKGLEFLKVSIEKNKNDWKSLEMAGRICMNLHQTAEAEKYFKEAVRVSASLNLPEDDQKRLSDQYDKARFRWEVADPNQDLTARPEYMTGALATDWFFQDEKSHYPKVEINEVSGYDATRFSFIDSKNPADKLIAKMKAKGIEPLKLGAGHQPRNIDYLEYAFAHYGDFQTEIEASFGKIPFTADGKLKPDAAAQFRKDLDQEKALVRKALEQRGLKPGQSNYAEAYADEIKKPEHALLKLYEGLLSDETPLREKVAFFFKAEGLKQKYAATSHAALALVPGNSAKAQKEFISAGEAFQKEFELSGRPDHAKDSANCFYAAAGLAREEGNIGKSKDLFLRGVSVLQGMTRLQYDDHLLKDKDALKLMADGLRGAERYKEAIQVYDRAWMAGDRSPELDSTLRFTRKMFAAYERLGSAFFERIGELEAKEKKPGGLNPEEKTELANKRRGLELIRRTNATEFPGRPEDPQVDSKDNPLIGLLLDRIINTLNPTDPTTRLISRLSKAGLDKLDGQVSKLEKAGATLAKIDGLRREILSKFPEYVQQQVLKTGDWSLVRLDYAGATDLPKDWNADFFNKLPILQSLRELEKTNPEAARQIREIFAAFQRPDLVTGLYDLDLTQIGEGPGGLLANVGPDPLESKLNSFVWDVSKLERDFFEADAKGHIPENPITGDKIFKTKDVFRTWLGETMKVDGRENPSNFVQNGMGEYSRNLKALGQLMKGLVSLKKEWTDTQTKLDQAKRAGDQAQITLLTAKQEDLKKRIAELKKNGKELLKSHSEKFKADFETYKAHARSGKPGVNWTELDPNFGWRLAFEDELKTTQAGLETAVNAKDIEGDPGKDLDRLLTCYQSMAEADGAMLKTFSFLNSALAGAWIPAKLQSSTGGMGWVGAYWEEGSQWKQGQARIRSLASAKDLNTAEGIEKFLRGIDAYQRETNRKMFQDLPTTLKEGINAQIEMWEGVRQTMMGKGEDVREIDTLIYRYLDAKKAFERGDTREALSLFKLATDSKRQIQAKEDFDSFQLKEQAKALALEAAIITAATVLSFGMARLAGPGLRAGTMALTRALGLGLEATEIAVGATALGLEATTFVASEKLIRTGAYGLGVGENPFAHIPRDKDGKIQWGKLALDEAWEIFKMALMFKVLRVAEGAYVEAKLFDRVMAQEGAEALAARARSLAAKGVPNAEKVMMEELFQKEVEKMWKRLKSRESGEWLKFQAGKLGVEATTMQAWTSASAAMDALYQNAVHDKKLDWREAVEQSATPDAAAHGLIMLAGLKLGAKAVHPVQGLMVTRKSVSADLAPKLKVMDTLQADLAREMSDPNFTFDATKRAEAKKLIEVKDRMCAMSDPHGKPILSDEEMFEWQTQRALLGEAIGAAQGYEAKMAAAFQSGRVWMKVEAGDEGKPNRYFLMPQGGGGPIEVTQMTYDIYSGWVKTLKEKGTKKLLTAAQVEALEKGFETSKDIVAPIPVEGKPGEFEFYRIKKGGLREKVDGATYQTFADWIGGKADAALGRYAQRITAEPKPNGQVLYTAYRGSQKVGTMVVQDDGNGIHIVITGTLAKHQGRGVFSQLFVQVTQGKDFVKLEAHEKTALDMLNGSADQSPQGLEATYRKTPFGKVSERNGFVHHELTKLPNGTYQVVSYREGAKPKPLKAPKAAPQVSAPPMAAAARVTTRVPVFEDAQEVKTRIEMALEWKNIQREREGLKQKPDPQKSETLDAREKTLRDKAAAEQRCLDGTPYAEKMPEVVKSIVDPVFDAKGPIDRVALRTRMKARLEAMGMKASTHEEGAIDSIIDLAMTAKQHGLIDHPKGLTRAQFYRVVGELYVPKKPGSTANTVDIGNFDLTHVPMVVEGALQNYDAVMTAMGQKPDPRQKTLFFLATIIHDGGKSDPNIRTVTGYTLLKGSLLNKSGKDIRVKGADDKDPKYPKGQTLAEAMVEQGIDPALVKLFFPNQIATVLHHDATAVRDRIQKWVDEKLITAKEGRQMWEDVQMHYAVSTWITNNSMRTDKGYWGIRSHTYDNPKLQDYYKAQQRLSDLIEAKAVGRKPTVDELLANPEIVAAERDLQKSFNELPLHVKMVMIADHFGQMDDPKWGILLATKAPNAKATVAWFYFGESAAPDAKTNNSYQNSVLGVLENHYAEVVLLDPALAEKVVRPMFEARRKWLSAPQDEPGLAKTIKDDQGDKDNPGLGPKYEAWAKDQPADKNTVRDWLDTVRIKDDQGQFTSEFQRIQKIIGKASAEARRAEALQARTTVDQHPTERPTFRPPPPPGVDRPTTQVGQMDPQGRVVPVKVEGKTAPTVGEGGTVSRRDVSSFLQADMKVGSTTDLGTSVLSGAMLRDDPLRPHDIVHSVTAPGAGHAKELAGKTAAWMKAKGLRNVETVEFTDPKGNGRVEELWITSVDVQGNRVAVEIHLSGEKPPTLEEAIDFYNDFEAGAGKQIEKDRDKRSRDRTLQDPPYYVAAWNAAHARAAMKSVIPQVTEMEAKIRRGEMKADDPSYLKAREGLGLYRKVLMHYAEGVNSHSELETTGVEVQGVHDQSASPADATRAGQKSPPKSIGAPGAVSAGGESPVPIEASSVSNFLYLRTIGTEGPDLGVRPFSVGTLHRDPFNEKSITFIVTAAGPGHAKDLVGRTEAWMKEHGFRSLDSFDLVSRSGNAPEGVVVAGYDSTGNRAQVEIRFSQEPSPTASQAADALTRFENQHGKTLLEYLESGKRVPSLQMNLEYLGAFHASNARALLKQRIPQVAAMEAEIAQGKRPANDPAYLKAREELGLYSKALEVYAKQLMAKTEGEGPKKDTGGQVIDLASRRPQRVTPQQHDLAAAAGVASRQKLPSIPPPPTKKEGTPKLIFKIGESDSPGLIAPSTQAKPTWRVKEVSADRKGLVLENTEDPSTTARAVTDQPHPFKVGEGVERLGLGGGGNVGRSLEIQHYAQRALADSKDTEAIAHLRGFAQEGDARAIRALAVVAPQNNKAGEALADLVEIGDSLAYQTLLEAVARGEGWAEKVYLFPVKGQFTSDPQSPARKITGTLVPYAHEPSMNHPDRFVGQVESVKEGKLTVRNRKGQIYVLEAGFSGQAAHPFQVGDPVVFFPSLGGGAPLPGEGPGAAFHVNFYKDPKRTGNLITVLGRSQNQELSTLDTISNEHAQISYQEFRDRQGEVFRVTLSLTDLGSTNGTYIYENGQWLKIEKRDSRPLQFDQVFALGHDRFFKLGKDGNIHPTTNPSKEKLPGPIAQEIPWSPEGVNNVSLLGRPGKKGPNPPNLLPLDDATISREHAKLIATPDGRRFLVALSRSETGAHGTWVKQPNNIWVKLNPGDPPYELHPNQEFILGTLTTESKKYHPGAPIPDSEAQFKEAVRCRLFSKGNEIMVLSDLVNQEPPPPARILKAVTADKATNKVMIRPPAADLPNTESEWLYFTQQASGLWAAPIGDPVNPGAQVLHYPDRQRKLFAAKGSGSDSSVWIETQGEIWRKVLPDGSPLYPGQRFAVGKDLKTAVVYTQSMDGKFVSIAGRVPEVAAAAGVTTRTRVPVGVSEVKSPPSAKPRPQVSGTLFGQYAVNAFELPPVDTQTPGYVSLQFGQGAEPPTLVWGTRSGFAGRSFFKISRENGRYRLQFMEDAEDEGKLKIDGMPRGTENSPLSPGEHLLEIGPHQIKIVLPVLK